MSDRDPRWEDGLGRYLERVLEERAGRAPEGNGHGRPAAEADRELRTPLAGRLATARPVTVQPQLAVIARPRPVLHAAVRRPHLDLVAHRRWSTVVLGDLPHTPVPPAPAAADPVAAGDVVLWPDPLAGVAYVAATAPALLDVGVGIERSTVGGTERTTGGAATLVLSAAPVAALEQLADRREGWVAALRARFPAVADWRFEPLRITSLTAALDLPAAHVRTPPRATTNPDAATATFLVELTDVGALAWRTALTAVPPRAPEGVCTLEAGIYTHAAGARVDVRTQRIAAPLAAYAAQLGPHVVRTVDPEQAVDATLVVDGHPTLASAVVDMRASGGSSHSEVFGPEGGTVVLGLAPDDPAAERVEWSARVSYQSAAWPVVRHAGVLSRTAGWVDLINPSSWIRQLAVTTMVVGDDGRVLAPEAAGADHVSGVVTFTAPFVDAPAGLQTTFATSSQETTRVMVPAPPGAGGGELKLTVLALRGAAQQFTVRTLARDEDWALVKVHPDARIEIMTNRTPLAERSPEAEVAPVLDRLVPARGSAPAGGPVVRGPASAARDGAPPAFDVVPGANPHYVFEIAARPGLLAGAAAGERTASTYWASDLDPGAGFLSAPALALPGAAWAALRGADRLFYRVWTSAAAGAWQDAQVSTPDAILDDAPVLTVR